MSVSSRWSRSVGHRGVLGTLLHLPVAALRPLVLAIRQSRSAARARRLPEAREPVLLHLASGPERLKKWVNVDLYFPAELCLDLTRPLPIPDGCVDAIYSQHFIEHISKQAAEDLIHECARVLKPDGWLRICTPDLETLAKLYLGKIERWEVYLQRHAEATGRVSVTPADALNDAMRLYDHAYLHDFESLGQLFEDAGFVDIRRARPGMSVCVHLEGRETRTTPDGIPDLDLIVEGRRP